MEIFYILLGVWVTRYTQLSIRSLYKNYTTIYSGKEGVGAVPEAEIKDTKEPRRKLQIPRFPSACIRQTSASPKC